MRALVAAAFLVVAMVWPHALVSEPRVAPRVVSAAGISIALMVRPHGRVIPRNGTEGGRPFWKIIQDPLGR